MATLYELSIDYEQAILNGFTVDAETGEVIDYSPEMLEQLDGDLNTKLEQCGIFIKNLDAESEAIRVEERKLAHRRKVKQNKAEAMKQYVRNCMNISKTKKVTTARVDLGLRTSHKLIVDNISEVPEKYVIEKVDRKADAMEIKRALKRGEVIAGVHIEDNENVTIK